MKHTRLNPYPPLCTRGEKFFHYGARENSFEVGASVPYFISHAGNVTRLHIYEITKPECEANVDIHIKEAYLVSIFLDALNKAIVIDSIDMSKVIGHSNFSW